MVERTYRTKDKAVKTKTAKQKTPAKGKTKTVKRVGAPKPAQLYWAKVYTRSQRNLYGGREVAQTEPVRSFSALIESVDEVINGNQNKYAVVYRADRTIGYIYRGNCYYPDDSYSEDCYIWKYAQDAQKDRDRVYELICVGGKWDFYDFHKAGMEYDEGYDL